MNKNPMIYSQDILLRYPIFQSCHSVFSFSTTCHGGVSEEKYKSLNLSFYSGDKKENVIKNRKLLANYLNLDIDDLYIPFQTHGDKVGMIDHSFFSLTTKEKEQKLHGIDALITQEKNICIGVTTADCVPIIIYDPEHQALGVVHAGWKGTALRITEKTIDRMIVEFQSNPQNLIASIGPSISQTYFEVGDEVGKAFQDAEFDLDLISYRNKQTDKLHINLWEANKLQLAQLGLKDRNIEIANICTFQNVNYFSARRQTIHSGRMLTGGILR